MTDGRDPASIIEAAQKAAGDGDYPAAERLLQEAAAIQEASLGSSHPDVATTLNNLAFVYERTNKFEAAERGYRRAHAIAVASLSPGHPFIKTSLSNLVEFCASRGIPIWTPPASPIEDEPLADDADGEPLPEDADVEPAIEAAPDVVREPIAASRLGLRMMAGAALVIATILGIVFVRQGQGTTTSSSVEPSVAKEIPAPPRESQPAPLRESPAAVAPERRPTPSTAPVTVLSARLCSALEKRGSPDWQCAPVNDEPRPGTYTFYTRLLTTANTTVEHRWYHNNRMHQVMRLRVTASPGSGYRTFSSNTVSAERAGDWKVELRATDGTLLQDEHFNVR